MGGEGAGKPQLPVLGGRAQGGALAYLGQRSAAGAAVARLLAQEPRFSQSFARGKLFYLKDPEQLRMGLEGLALAGVPAGQ